MKAIAVFLLLNILCCSKYVFIKKDLIDYHDVDTVALAIFDVDIIENSLVNRSISGSLYHNFYYKKIPDSLEMFYRNILSPSLMQSIELAFNKKNVLKVTTPNKSKYRIKLINEKKTSFLFKSETGFSIFYRTNNLPRYLISINNVKTGMRDNILNSPTSNSAHPDMLIDILETKFKLILWDYTDNKDIINTVCTINTPVSKNNLTKNDIEKHLQSVSKIIVKKMKI